MGVTSEQFDRNSGWQSTDAAHGAPTTHVATISTTTATTPAAPAAAGKYLQMDNVYETYMPYEMYISCYRMHMISSVLKQNDNMFCMYKVCYCIHVDTQFHRYVCIWSESVHIGILVHTSAY